MKDFLELTDEEFREWIMAASLRMLKAQAEAAKKNEVTMRQQMEANPQWPTFATDQRKNPPTR